MTVIPLLGHCNMCKHPISGDVISVRRTWIFDTGPSRGPEMKFCSDLCVSMFFMKKDAA